LYSSRLAGRPGPISRAAWQGSERGVRLGARRTPGAGAREVLGWPKRCELAHASRWECS
jgi:hypothetical protein